ncbi:MAG: filamentous hemagglutinin N-terminal domain-containing protein, partial [Burkholderiales bacterium]|nr:filamentous hemagglutinin N-terminal domain-containing protein [Burkholderiales bacterium]
MPGPASSPPQSPHPLSLALSAAFAGAVCTAWLPGIAHANPQGGQVVQGQASFATSGNRLTVINTPGAAINWQSFSIRPGETTHFQQQSAASSVLNRVVTANPTEVFGTLSSNGRIVLVNPAGIAVGRGAVVDTAGFTASTLLITDSDWALGRMRFLAAPGSGAVQVDGSIRSANGDIVLLAPQVGVGANALVRADNGSVILAAGRKAEITGRGLEGITLELKSPAETATNLGRLEGDAVGIFAGTLRHSGAISARTAAQEGGRVVLRADSEARLDEGSRIQADAAAAGNGGSITIWSEGNTQALGALSARGGTQAGDGGFIETSARRRLEVTRAPDLSAAAGRAGTWLLDPEDITIAAAPSSNISGATPFTPSGAGSSTLDVTVLTTALNGGTSVIIDTTGGGSGTGNINVNASVLKIAGPDATLTLRAHNDININSTLSSSSNKLNVVLVANQDAAGGGTSVVNAGINTNGGTITATGGSGAVTLGNVGITGALSATTVGVAGGLSGGNLTLAAGTMNWTGGALGSGTLNISSGAVLNLVNTIDHPMNGQVLNNSGTVTTNLGPSNGLLVQNGSTFNNLAGGVFEFKSDSYIG